MKNKIIAVVFLLLVGSLGYYKYYQYKHPESEPTPTDV